MRVLSKRQLKEMVLYSPQHVTRLEKVGAFPKRIQLDPNRVGWVEAELLDWLQQQLDCREVPNRHSLKGAGGWMCTIQHPTFQRHVAAQQSVVGERAFN